MSHERLAKELRVSVVFCKVTIDEIAFLKEQLEAYRREHEAKTKSVPAP